MLSFISFSSAATFTVHAQQVKVHITVEGENTSRAVIVGEYSEPISRLSFLNSYGTALGLGDRITQVEVWKENEQPIAAQKVAPGEFRASTSGTHFRYGVTLGSPEVEGDMAHVSWLAAGMGYLMLADLLPELGTNTSLSVDFTLPPGWNVSSSTQPSGGHYVIDEPARAVFFVGQSLRTKTKMIGATQITFVTARKWSFTDDQAVEVMARIINYYERSITPVPRKQTALFLAPYRTVDSNARWNAETRGGTTAIVFNEGDHRIALAQLGIALTHELFHLWVPNGLAFTGDYDWFFEGFTLYQALRTAVELRFIDFPEYLRTMSRVYQSYLAQFDRDQLSLIDASRRRFTGGSAAVNDKAMLLAFMYDLTVRTQSEGALSIDDVYRSLFKQHDGKPQDANQVIIKTLSAYGANQLIESYAVGNAAIHLDAFVNQYGLRIQSPGSDTQLVINRNLNSAQRRLLRSLGFKG